MVSQIFEKLSSELTDLAKDVISNNLNMSVKQNKEFFNDPDSVYYQNPWWHQWGIITHTKMTEKYYIEEVPFYLEKWSILKKTNRVLSDKIDRIEKETLFRIGILLHDIGKFKVRKIKYNHKGKLYYSFKGHEKASGKIIREEYFTEKLKKEYLLTHAQIQYISLCAEKHFELGTLRDKAKKSKLGYTKEFLVTSLFEKSVKEILSKASGLEWEIGLFFLADTLGKTDLRLEDENDKEELNKASRTIAKRKLDKNLIKGLKQLPISIEVSKRYFEYCH